MANFFLISAIVEVDCTAARVRHVDDTLAKLSKMTLVKTRMVNLSTVFISTVFHSAFLFFRFFAFLQLIFDCGNCPGWDYFPLVVEEKEEEVNVSGKSGVLKRGGKKESGKKNKNRRREKKEERYKDMTRWKKRRGLVESLRCEDSREERWKKRSQRKHSRKSVRTEQECRMNQKMTECTVLNGSAWSTEDEMI